ncbi:MAG: hypothetical protein RSB08_01995, partial [Clostridia bacterium]
LPDPFTPTNAIFSPLLILNETELSTSTSDAGYLKQTFILSEYRRDLYELINDIDIGAMARFWRRLYNDAGYWLKNYLTNAQLMRCLSLSAELSENTLLKHIKRIGFLEDFI